jgi:carbamoyl-phosphate synthase large subunit
VKERFNILISAAGRRVALMQIFRRALDRLDLAGEILATDVTRAAPAFHAADRGFQVPHARDAAFIPTLLQICREHSVRLLVPTNDHELPRYAAHRDEFAGLGTRVAISAPEVVEIGRDKQRTHFWLVSHGFPTVRQATAAELLEGRAHLDFPLIAKPRFGSASIGVTRVHEREELERLARGGERIVQELAPGVEHTVDLLIDRNGRCRCAVPRRRLEVRAGEVSKGLAVRIPALQSLARRLGETLPGTYGCLNFQVFFDGATERSAIIELNPRFGGGYPLSYHAGATFPEWLIEEILGRPTSCEADGWEDGWVMLRYDEAIFVRAGQAGLP